MDREQLTSALEAAGLELVIGLETHIRLNTATKLFCACPNQESDTPNVNICPTCTGQMGVLPSINKEAIRKAIVFGKAIQSSMKNEVISWDRKHYEYPDQPKNFQLTQFKTPIIPDGTISCYREDGTVFSVVLEQTHLEEDAAKLMHEKNQTLVDFNKSGVPLIEVVTKPCMRNIKDAATYAQYLQRTVQNLKISEANLEKGEFKSDVSVSLRKIGSTDLNARTEIKNLNSFKFMMDAIVEEITKQLAYYEENKAFRPDQTTVLWDADLKQTKTMRKKEFAADYRFAHEPDIPYVNIKKTVDGITIDQSLMPFAIETELIQGGVRPVDAKFFTSEAERSAMYLAINEQIKDALFTAKTLLNNIKPEDYFVIDKKSLTAIFVSYKAGKITPVLMQHAIAELLNNEDFDYNKYFEENSVSDDKLFAAIDVVLAENKAVGDEIKAGNHAKAGQLIAKVIAIVGKGADGKVIRESIISRLTTGEKTEAKLETLEVKVNSETGEVSMPEEELRQVPIIIKENYRTHKNDQLTEANLGEEVTVSGWVSSIRDHGELIFIDLRDSSYQLLQVRVYAKSVANKEDVVRLKPESVIMVTGILVKRDEADFNPAIKTGTFELETKVLEILNMSKTLPFELKRAKNTSETVRSTFKFLDHRSEDTRRAIINRHKVLKLCRDYLDNNGFIEIETPILTAGTEEGAREFIVPSRKFHGAFYTLPQAPQQFKQLLMVGGFERYFQVARCFRDEDSRGDRQPEFTQLDMELSYVSMKEIMNLNAELLLKVINDLYGGKWRVKPFQIITYKDSMDKYGCDRPDLRYGLEMEDITEIVKESDFQVFKKPITDGGIVKCIKVGAELQKQRLSKGQIEKLTALAQEHGLGGLAYIFVNEDELQSPIIKFLGEEVAAKIIAQTKAQVGDVVFFSAADYATANKALDAVRQELAQLLNLIDPKVLCPAWVVDFPQFEMTDDGRWTFSHNPFSMPAVADLDKHLKGEDIRSIIAQQYDLVLNGYEIGGGSVRAHKAEILEATYRNMGYNKEEMIKSVGTMYQAFQYGAPPHGGIAWGIDRLLMILERKTSIREVMAFPKTGSGEDLLFKAPSILPDKKVREQNVMVIKK
jgi:aspartyl-tRNA synthetase